MDVVKENNKQIEILTDAGWSRFAGVVKKPPCSVVTVECEHGSLTCTPDHMIYTDTDASTAASMLKVGDTVLHAGGKSKVLSITAHVDQLHVYDILSVEKGNRFYANDILISNCKFLTADETLINAVTLLKLQGVDPRFKVNEVRWYDEIRPNQIYVCALDPSAGVGKDYSAIEVFSLPDMKQVAEWSHNRTSIPNQVKTMQNLVNYLYNEQKRIPGHRGEPEIYFTVENNSWGEAALLTINEIGEERFNGQMLNEPRVRGMARPRKGLNTNGRTKSLACSKLKSLVEAGKLKVHSRPLVRQLKMFVSKGDSFAAKQGENDDCVMSTLMCIRMMQMVQNWDDRVGDLLKDDFGDDFDHSDPMPMSVIIS